MISRKVCFTFIWRKKNVLHQDFNYIGG
jgi:hypothetical protein